LCFELLSELKKVQAASREEAGCIKYDLHQSEDQTIVLYEVWKDEEALEHHIQSAHYQEYRNNIADLVLTREVYKQKKWNKFKGGVEEPSEKPVICRFFIVFFKMGAFLLRNKSFDLNRLEG
jgi:quinol monooxygenase YgiN